MNGSVPFHSSESSFPLTYQNLGSSARFDLSIQDRLSLTSRSHLKSTSMLSRLEAEVEVSLERFAKSRSFFQVLRTAFGDSFSLGEANRLRRQWLIGHFETFPKLQIQGAETLNGASSAFSAETNTIYLSQSVTQQYARRQDILTGLLLEEFGHFIDSKINTSDAAGDEGAVFAALLQGVRLRQETLATLKTEDDTATISLNGRSIQVEQSVSETGNGLWAEYFDNANLTNLRLTRNDGTVNFNWGAGSPNVAIAPDTFSVRWTGQVQPLTSGTYKFFTQSNDGIRLWVNGQRIINNWTNHNVTENRGSITLTAGQKYDIRLEYYDNTGSAVARLLWSGPGVSKQVIPQARLFSQPVDLVPPTATLNATNVVTSGTTPYQFTVTYADNTAMNIATLNNSDILIAGTNGFNQMAALVRVDNATNGTPRTATYQIDAPGGSWDLTDNGSYSLLLQPNQVSDTSSNFIPARTLGSFLVSLEPENTNVENIVFPADAGVVNVRNFGARGDGITDDTAAIQAALNAYPNGKRIIYLPNGTYLVSKTLSWPAGTPDTGNDYKNTILQGQSETGVIIRLKDEASGFTDPDNPQSVIFTGPAPAQRFGNSIRTLTVDTGSRNPGAIGIQFNASNQGSMRQVTVRSGDRQGVAGLDFDFADEIGPLLVKEVTVNGFQYGITTGYTVNSQTFEDITLQNQSVYGFWNYSQVVSIRNLTSHNTVPAIYNGVGGTSHMTLLNASLNGTGASTTQPAIINGGTLLARDITTAGYQTAIASGNTTIPGPTVSEFVSSPLSRLSSTATTTLGLPIQETPDVPWDDPVTAPWANVVTYGAIPNDDKDDTAAIQAAIDSGRTTVYFPVGNYDLQGTVLVRNQVRRMIGTEAYIDVPETVNPGFKIVDGSHPVVVFERLRSWYNSTPTIENSSARTLVVRDATDVSLSLTGSGNLFLENVATSALSIHGQQVWARQLNIENLGTKITNNGGNLWILGFKTERGGTLIDTQNGGKTELLGGLAYTTTPGPDGTQNYPLFINQESDVSISFAEINYGAPLYTTYVREIRGGITRNLTGSSLPDYWGNGQNIPLYLGY